MYYYLHHCLGAPSSSNQWNLPRIKTNSYGRTVILLSRIRLNMFHENVQNIYQCFFAFFFFLKSRFITTQLSVYVRQGNHGVEPSKHREQRLILGKRTYVSMPSSLYWQNTLGRTLANSTTYFPTCF